jgi:isopentenyl-diphosphate Delta-isomerase
LGEPLRSLCSLASGYPLHHLRAFHALRWFRYYPSRKLDEKRYTWATRMNNNINQTNFRDIDPSAVARKKDHIELALRAQLTAAVQDKRFFYEPLLAAHPKNNADTDFEFLGKTCRAPLWVSSMTGGTAMARHINQNLARAAAEFGFGMGLGSCRSLLTDDAYLADFDVRGILGDGLPLYANLGIAQVEQLLQKKETHLIEKLVEKLRADGLILHINPMQEWLQPEGDRFAQSPLETIQQIMAQLPQLKYIVKEVGQGMGPASLEALLRLPLQAVDFAAYGGTNFAKIELLRAQNADIQNYENLANIGHTAYEMVDFCNDIIGKLQASNQLKCQQIIISGGIQQFLDGYFLINKLSLPAIYGQAAAFLTHARGEYQDLRAFVAAQIKGLAFAKSYLRVR